MKRRSSSGRRYSVTTRRPGVAVGDAGLFPIGRHLRQALAAELASHVVEGGGGIRTNRTNRRQAYDHDERQHNGVLNRGRAIFRDEETLHLLSKTLHSIHPFSGSAHGEHDALMVVGSPQK